MNGRADWSTFAKGHGFTWENGPAAPRDQYGTEYCTLIWSGDKAHLLKVLGEDKHVVIRMFPHPADPRGKDNDIRMRFTSYAQRPCRFVE